MKQHSQNLTVWTSWLSGDLMMSSNKEIVGCNPQSAEHYSHYNGVNNEST